MNSIENLFPDTFNFVFTLVTIPMVLIINQRVKKYIYICTKKYLSRERKKKSIKSLPTCAKHEPSSYSKKC